MEELERIEVELRRIADRLAQLRHQGPHEEGPIPLLSATAPQEPLLSQVLERLSAEVKGEGASVLIAGVHSSSSGQVATWYKHFSNEDIEKILQPELIRALEALASLERLRLMLALAVGPKGSAELMNDSGLTQGQFYHHVRILEGSGLIHKKGRDEYEATLHGISSLFTVLAAASYLLRALKPSFLEEPKEET